MFCFSGEFVDFLEHNANRDDVNRTETTSLVFIILFVFCWIHLRTRTKKCQTRCRW